MYKKVSLKFFICLFTILTPIIFFLQYKNFYKSYVDYGAFASQYSREEIEQNFEEFMNFAAVKGSTLDSEFFSNEDILHAYDVRNLFKIVYIIYLICILGIIILRKDLDLKIIRNAGIINILVFLLIGFISILNFSKSFILFHKLLFRNDYWLLDPDTSNLIKYFPQKVFSDIGTYISFFVIISSLLSIGLWIIQRKKSSLQEDI